MYFYTSIHNMGNNNNNLEINYIPRVPCRDNVRRYAARS